MVGSENLKLKNRNFLKKIFFQTFSGECLRTFFGSSCNVFSHVSGLLGVF